MILCIVGPTGVGKTRLSEELSIKYDAIIVNGDAMQVYKGMDIGTAKYTKEEDLGQKHFLFDIVEASCNYTVFDYQKELRKILNQYKDRNIIIVGGSGLYLKAGLFNYEFEKRTANSYDEYSNEELYQMIKSRGMENEVHPNNRRRMISRLNSNGNNNLKDQLLYDNVYFIGLTTDREILYSKIDKRVDEMINKGLVEEVKRLYLKYGPTKALKTAIGYKELIEYFEGKQPLEKAIDNIKRNSRKFAKRQYTWYKHQMNVKWFDVDYENFDNTQNAVMDFVDEANKII